jgi:hypothetical protein
MCILLHETSLGRRRFLRGVAGLFVAPAIVHAENIMRVRPVAWRSTLSELVDNGSAFVMPDGWRVFTASEIINSEKLQKFFAQETVMPKWAAIPYPFAIPYPSEQEF